MGRWLLRSVLPPVFALVLILALWEAGVRVFEVKSYVLPAPTAVIKAVRNQHGPLLRGLWITAQAAMLGFALSAVLGVLIGIGLASSRWAERALYPFMIVFQTVPLVAIAPILTVRLGYGLRPVIASACIVSIFPVVANTLAGLKSVDPALLDLFRLYGSGWFSRLFKLMLPASFPAIFTGLRVAAGLAVIGTIVAELTSGSGGNDAGLGVQVMLNINWNNADRTFAAIAMATLLGLTLFGTVNIAGYLLLRRWHASAQERA